MITELTVFLMTVNFLEITPLFFLGATLTFIGFDLMYEWIVEVRHKLLLSEYAILLVTFGSIHIIGIDGGIAFGILVAAIDYVIVTAKASTLIRVNKRSRAVWNREEWQLLEQSAYHIKNPKIVTFEVNGNVFFGSSLHLLTAISHDLNIITTDDDRKEMANAMVSPIHRPSQMPNLDYRGSSVVEQRSKTPDFLVLDLKQMQNLDASAARGCFYQLTKMCGKRGIVICASSPSPRVDWVLRSHGITYSDDMEEFDIKKKLIGDFSVSAALNDSPKIILFDTVYEALEFCESSLLLRMISDAATPMFRRSLSASALLDCEEKEGSSIVSRYTLSAVFTEYLGLTASESSLLEKYESSVVTFHDELLFQSGETIFSYGQSSDAFYIILSGSVVVHQKVAVHKMTIKQKLERQKFKSSVKSKNEHHIITGAGILTHSMRKHSFESKTDDTLGEQKHYLRLGSIFGKIFF